MTNYAQETKLSLKTKIGLNGKCIIEDTFFTPPLKLMSPFYEDDTANIMLISVSAGLMEGDHQEMDFDIGQDCKVKLTSQSFEKIHNTQKGFASRNTQIKIANNATFDFSPLPIIPFANSDFRGSTTIYLKTNSNLIYSEIITAGRTSRDEIFAFKNFSSKLKIYKENKPIFFDNTLLDPKTIELNNVCLFDNYTHYLNLIIIGNQIPQEYLKETIIKSNLNIGISELQTGGFCIKALSKNSEDLLFLREKIAK
ncbi:urease accessory protein UreD [Helicobacter sp. 13S00477-4]|uniref:urease accessory protein UreD n=1 Tax=Helicobacter sp. 13S00477-4 TaxID=1905759 RepID=UPI000BA79088|nr:urease accessory protein UreD [Helicobacter sp. 13S00477-4]PAF51597.1 urease accessory protein [Helicobacter sp. 13S00477-4]